MMSDLGEQKAANKHFYRSSLHKQTSWVIMKRGSVEAICIFQKSSA